MSDLDDLLADESEENEEQTTTDNKAIAEVRRWGKKQEKLAKEYFAELEELRTFKAEADLAARAAKIGEAFKEVGLNEKFAKLYAAMNPEAEVTGESVAQFAIEYGLAAEDSISVPEAPAPSFTPTSGASPAPTQKMSRDEWRQLMATNPQAAQEALARGRVDSTPPTFPSPQGF